MSWLLIQWHLSGPKSQSRINSKFDRRLSAANCMGSTGRFDFLSSSLPSETPWKAHSLVQISAHQANPLQALNYRRKTLIEKNPALLPHNKIPSTMSQFLKGRRKFLTIGLQKQAPQKGMKACVEMYWRYMSLESRGIEGKRGIQHHHSKKVQKSQKSQKDI